MGMNRNLPDPIHVVIPGLVDMESRAFEGFANGEIVPHRHLVRTELVYRHQIVPALTRGAEVMDQIFG